ncbi:translation initiation factor [Joostella atrarenae]|uniref:Translation initiation factor n=1 Tax=Joostella atrarenae TaxID=679257 RepID=A0ABS9J216_9FLAO|nr:translation initiation factor [Joostella atrarenae]MCF8714390.1 translation initiation factor [Joostella atrarenae]
MDIQDQLKNLFPDHEFQEEPQKEDGKDEIWMQDEPLLCKYEKRKGKPITIIDGYTGATEDFKKLAKELKTKLSVGGSFKDDKIIIQGDYRDKIMTMLKEKGFKVKRVGG